MQLSGCHDGTYIININFGFGRCLHERAVELIRKRLAQLFSHNSLILQITFVANQNHWNVVSVLKKENQRSLSNFIIDYNVYVWLTLTLKICSRRSCKSLNVDCAVME